MLKIENVTTLNQFEELGKVWNTLLSRSSSNNIFLTWEWISNWWRVYRNGKNLLVLTVRDQNDDLLAVAPLYTRVATLLKYVPVREVRFLGTGEDVSPDYLDIVAKKGYEEAAAKTIVNYLKKHVPWDVLDLTDLLPTSPAALSLQKVASENGLATRKMEHAVCPYIPLPASWAEYLSTLSKNTRYNVNRRMRNLERDFHARFFVWDDVQHLEAGMKRLALLHNKRWDQKNSRHSFSTDRYISFHQAVAGAFASKGWLQLSCLELNGEIAGMYYDYCYNNKIYYYQGGFDPALQKYSPGLVLRAHIIQKAIADGLEEIDLLKGAYDYKYMWTNVSRSTVRLIIGKNSPAYKLLDFYIAKKPQLKSSLTKILPEKIVRAIKNAAI